jgi:hypothetical protein
MATRHKRFSSSGGPSCPVSRLARVRRATTSSPAGSDGHGPDLIGQVVAAQREHLRAAPSAHVIESDCAVNAATRNQLLSRVRLAGGGFALDRLTQFAEWHVYSLLSRGALGQGRRSGTGSTFGCGPGIVVTLKGPSDKAVAQDDELVSVRFEN